jgi:hypothetical protein
MNLVDQVFHEIITPFLEPRIKKNSLKAVKGYVKTIQGLRVVAISLYSASAIAAVMVSGIVLMIVAIVGLLPIDPRAALIGLLVLGAIMTGVAAFLTVGAFKEQVWLEKSKANDLMEATLKPWETPFSVPDYRKIFSGEAKSAPAHPKVSADDAALTSRPLGTTSALQS